MEVANWRAFSTDLSLRIVLQHVVSHKLQRVLWASLAHLLKGSHYGRSHGCIQVHFGGERIRVQRRGAHHCFFLGHQALRGVAVATLGVHVLSSLGLLVGWAFLFNLLSLAVIRCLFHFQIINFKIISFN